MPQHSAHPERTEGDPMPIYSYRCPDCSDFDVQLPMGQTPELLPCPVCKTASSRRFTAPNLSRASGSAYRLIEATRRSAAEPAVVRSPAGGSRARPTAGGITTNPLHRRLPRPD